MDKLSNLYRDRNIDEKLKDIAKLLKWDVRSKLRETRITSLEDEVGEGNWDSEYVVGELIKKVQEHAKENPDDKFKKASVCLFAWIVGQKEWDLLRGFPVFAKDGSSVLDLPTAHGGEPPLAPVSAWPEGLEQFANLFPPDRILADDFFEAVRAPGVWEQLDGQKPRLIRRSMITTRKETVNFKDFFPEEELPEGNHKTVDCISVTDVVERVKIMGRVSDDQDRAHRFWQFLTDWLIKEDVQSLETKKTKCECGEIHEYYPAAWVMPVRNNRWIRLPKDKWASADAQSLASLFRDNGWNPSSIDGNFAAVGLLKAIGVSLSDLKLEFITENSEQRNELVNTMTELHQVTQGNLNQIHALVQYLRDDEELIPHLAERQKRRELVFENQDLGRWVEKVVKESLEGVGFDVNRKPIGSDFEIEHDLVENDEEMGIELTQEDQSWLVEVKATRGKRVRMTSTQAKTAVKEKDNFLLCVVPLDPGDTKAELDAVRTKMRFVSNIGSRLTTLCNNLEALEELQDEITAGDSCGVQLKVVSGTAQIQVASSIWENDGFPLENLVEQLKQAKNT